LLRAVRAAVAMLLAVARLTAVGAAVLVVTLPVRLRLTSAKLIPLLLAVGAQAAQLTVSTELTLHFLAWPPQQVAVVEVVTALPMDCPAVRVVVVVWAQAAARVHPVKDLPVVAVRHTAGVEVVVHRKSV
jgi:hypothetical protein